MKTSYVHGHLVAPPSLPADGHRAAQREEVGQLGQRQEAEAGAETDEATEGGCGEGGGIQDTEF